MKRFALLLAALLACLLLSSCGQGQTPPREAAPEDRAGDPQTSPQEKAPEARDGDPQPAEREDGSFEGTVFHYGDQDYDLSQRVQAVNAILSVVPAGQKLVIECHAGPKNGVYCIFDTESQTFDEDVLGNHLIWYGDDLATGVYDFWSEVRAYDGSVIKTYDLPEGAYIYGLAFSEDHTALHVTILKEDGTDETDTIPLPEA